MSRDWSDTRQLRSGRIAKERRLGERIVPRLFIKQATRIEANDSRPRPSIAERWEIRSLTMILVSYSTPRRKGPVGRQAIYVLGLKQAKTLH